jgi:hypothetical protein
MAARRYRLLTGTYDSYGVQPAVQQAFAIFEQLQAEMQGWFDSLGRGLCTTDQAAAVLAAADALGEIEAVGVPSLLILHENEGPPNPIRVNRLAARAGRADKCEYAIRLMAAVYAYAVKVQHLQQVTVFCDSLKSCIVLARLVEFPGLYASGAVVKPQARARRPVKVSR